MRWDKMAAWTLASRSEEGTGHRACLFPTNLSHDLLLHTARSFKRAAPSHTPPHSFD